ncbi:unnamed protein product [Heterobilharzia americana]|nr:unnamed protein product [Heterobilharzia americana]
MTIVKRKCNSIFVLWDEIGFDGTELEEKVCFVAKQLEILLDNVLCGEEKQKTQLLESINELNMCIQEMSLELYNTSFDPLTSTPLLKTYNYLLKKKAEISKDAEDIIQRFESLKESEKSLCERLCETETPIGCKVIPSPEQLEILSRHVDHLVSIKAERSNRFVKLKMQMVAAYEKLGKPLELIANSNAFLSSVLAPDALETFTLSEENIYSMTDIADQLVTECEHVDIECNFHRERLNHLIHLLSPLGVSCDTIESENSSLILGRLRKEVDRLEAIRTRHLDTLISATRSQVYKYWDECFVGNEHRRNFEFSLQDNDNENVLRIFEKEVNIWSDFKKVNSHLLLDIVKWCENFSGLQTIKQRMQDPSVLQNRGGILLKLEKERKQLSREMSSLEGRIEQSFSQLLSTNPSLASAIRIGSKSLNPVDFIKHSLEGLHNDKENQKQGGNMPKSSNYKNAESRPVAGKQLKRTNPFSNETTMPQDFSSSSSISSTTIKHQTREERSVQDTYKKPEVIKSEVIPRRRSRSNPPSSQRFLPSTGNSNQPISYIPVLREQNPKPSKRVMDDIDLREKTALARPSPLDIESFYEGFKNNDKGPYASTFIHWP